MEKGDLVKYNPTGEFGVVVWHDENKKAIDVRVQKLYQIGEHAYIGHKYIYDKNIKQFTVLTDSKWEE